VRLPRRDFAALALKGACGLGFCSLFSLAAGSRTGRAAVVNRQPRAHKAMFWKAGDLQRLTCELCPRKCVVADLERGYCGVRENRQGTYYTLVHSQPCSINVDPIEKKPFFHVLPGTSALSLATPGCNVLCKFCQNWELSQARPEQLPAQDLPPSAVVELARRRRCRSIAFTYSEPVVFYEYVLDTATITAGSDLRTVVVSNGYINKEPLEKLIEKADAIKIDLKAFREEFYEKYVDGKLEPVLETLKTLRVHGRWFEIVTLLIPGLNDSPEEIADLSRWIMDNLGPDVPIHFTRFHPTFQMTDLPPTPRASLERAHDIARKAGIHYVYLGNLPGHEYENTFCHHCSKPIILRYGYFIRENRLKNGKCPDCGTTVPGIWS
jgi:pyruvate formate lyase activating enzyme